MFDEFNGSHGEQVDLSDVGEEDSSQDILTMGVGALLPMEKNLMTMKKKMEVSHIIKLLQHSYLLKILLLNQGP